MVKWNKNKVAPTGRASLFFTEGVKCSIHLFLEKYRNKYKIQKEHNGKYKKNLGINTKDKKRIIV